MNKVYDLIIIGAGPAGITAGIYASRQKMNTLFVTKDFGGQIGKKAVDIENYPGFKKITGSDLIKKLEEHLESQEALVERDEVVDVEKEGDKFLVKTANKKKFESYTVIVASGADPRPLEVPGEKEFIGRGISYCAVCDGPLFRDKTVAVIGGGNEGFEDAIFMTNYARKIYILEYGSKIKADETNQELVKKLGKTEIITNAKLERIEGDKFVDSIIYKDLKTKKDKELKVDGVFVAIGSQPATAFVKGLVLFNKRDEIIVKYETCQTKTEGLYAVGDCNTGRFKQVVTAAGEGAKAALAAYGYLQEIK